MTPKGDDPSLSNEERWDRRAVVLTQALWDALVERPGSSKEIALLVMGISVGTHIKQEIGHALLSHDLTGDLHATVRAAVQGLDKTGWVEVPEGEDEDEGPQFRLGPPPADGGLLN